MTFIIINKFYDYYRGVRGTLFSFVTICPEVVERPFERLKVLSNVEGHQIYADYGAAPRSYLAEATGILCACPPVLWRACPQNRRKDFTTFLESRR